MSLDCVLAAQAAIAAAGLSLAEVAAERTGGVYLTPRVSADMAVMNGQTPELSARLRRRGMSVGARRQSRRPPGGVGHRMVTHPLTQSIMHRYRDEALMWRVRPEADSTERSVTV